MYDVTQHDTSLAFGDLQVSFHADYVSQVKSTKWTWTVSFSFSSKHENIGRILLTFCLYKNWFDIFLICYVARGLVTIPTELSRQLFP
jgi:hypothetical protein